MIAFNMRRRAAYRALGVGVFVGGFLLPTSCGGPLEGAGLGEDCYRADDCQDGLICSPDGKCTNDLTGIISTIDGPAGDAPPAEAGPDGAGGTAPTGGGGAPTGGGGAPTGGGGAPTGGGGAPTGGGGAPTGGGGAPTGGGGAPTGGGGAPTGGGGAPTGGGGAPTGGGGAPTGGGGAPTGGGGAAGSGGGSDAATD